RKFGGRKPCSVRSSPHPANRLPRQPLTSAAPSIRQLLVRWYSENPRCLRFATDRSTHADDLTSIFQREISHRGSFVSSSSLRRATTSNTVRLSGWLPELSSYSLPTKIRPWVSVAMNAVRNKLAVPRCPS